MKRKKPSVHLGRNRVNTYAARITMMIADIEDRHHGPNSILQAGNPVKEILLKLNLPSHRSILTDLKDTPTKNGRMTKPYSSPNFIANHFITDLHKDGDREVVVWGRQVVVLIRVVMEVQSVPLTTIGDLHMLINDIEAGKHDELLSGMTNNDRMETIDALGTICNSIQADNTNTDVTSCKVLHVDDSINLNVDEFTMPSEPIVQSMDINTKSTFNAGATGARTKDQPKVNSNFRPLVVDPVFYGVNISIPHKVVKKVSTCFKHTLYGYFIGKRMVFLVVEYYARNNWAKHGLKRVMMNSKGFFFFKFDSRVGLEAILEGGPWLICKSLIILKKWLMDTRLLKEELTRISI
ncbi:zinc knuckle CX2CX4HX4C containing protein [Tanacetum coccineum]